MRLHVAAAALGSVLFSQPAWADSPPGTQSSPDFKKSISAASAVVSLPASKPETVGLSSARLERPLSQQPGCRPGSFAAVFEPR